MSTQAINWALDDVSDIKPTDKAVLFALANYAGADGACWPSQKTIARQCCMGERTVRRSLKTLEDAGWLSRSTRFNPATMQRKTDVVTLHIWKKSETKPDITEIPSDTPPAKMAAGHNTEDEATGQSGQTEKATGQSRPIPPAKMAAKPPVEPSLITSTNKGGKKKSAKYQIPEDWQPSDRVIKWADKQGIPREFWELLVDEFVIYWHDNGDSRPGWDSTFINKVTREWKKEKASPKASPNETVGGRNGKDIRNSQQQPATPTEQAQFDAIEHLKKVGAIPTDAGVGDQVHRVMDQDGADLSIPMDEEDGEGGERRLLLLDGADAGDKR